MVDAGFEIVITDVFVKPSAVGLVVIANHLPIERVFGLGVVIAATGEGHVHTVNAVLVDTEPPVELGAVVRGRDIVAHVVFACIAIVAGFGLPLAGGVVAIGVLEMVAEALLIVIVQHGHASTQSGLDPFPGVKLAFGKGEGLGVTHGASHDLDVQVGACGVAGLTDLSEVVPHLYLISNIEMPGAPIPQMCETDMVVAIDVLDHDGIAPTPIVVGVRAGVVLEIMHVAPDLHDLAIHRRVKLAAVGRIAHAVDVATLVEVETVVLSSLVGV